MSVYSEFRKLFSDPVGTSDRDESDVESEKEFAQALVSDYHTFFSTKALAEYEKWILVEIDKNDPDPDLGLEQAAARTFTQRGLKLAHRRLEQMRRALKEAMADAG